jgi:hypothetical protein
MKITSLIVDRYSLKSLETTLGNVNESGTYDSLSCL